MTELNDKTKTMLKLIEEDADSFVQRAKMYYKKRPELISMVEDFYRTHRSLAERYDQLKSDRVIRVKAPLRHSLSLPKEDYEYVLDSIDSFKPFDSLTDRAYTYEDAAESEVDDPEQENGDDKQFAAVECYDELMKLRGELDRLREENEVQKNVIKQKDDEKDEIVNRLSYNIKELKEETIAAKKENLGDVTKDTCEVIIPFDEVTNVKTEKKQVKKKESEVIEVMKKFEAEKTKSMYLEDELARKEEENVQVTMHLTETKFELAKVKEEMTRMNEQLKDTHVKKDEETKDMTRQVKHALTEEEELLYIKSHQLNYKLDLYIFCIYHHKVTSQYLL
ncbi:Protein NETWORKED 3A [Bienertia sinuspersici]